MHYLFYDSYSGTPHMTAIYNAFNSHEIACNTTPTVQDSGCSGNPVTAPTVTVLAGNMGATLNWNSVGAAKYQVLRTEGVFGCAQGKVLLGETSGTTWTDVGLMNNRCVSIYNKKSFIMFNCYSYPEMFPYNIAIHQLYRKYYYIVVPKGSKAACYGPSSDCKTVMPVEAVLPDGTPAPTKSPTFQPTKVPTDQIPPSAKPSSQPSKSPTRPPTFHPTAKARKLQMK